MNTKTESFWHKNHKKKQSKNSQNHETENPNSRLARPSEITVFVW